MITCSLSDRSKGGGGGGGGEIEQYETTDFCFPIVARCALVLSSKVKGMAILATDASAVPRIFV